MPTYTYQCRDCAHSFDIFQKFSEETLTVCPECSGAIRRVIQPTPIVFKGSGWYINDSKGKTSTGLTSKDEAPKSGDKSEKLEKSEKSENMKPENGKSEVAAKATDAPAKVEKAAEKTPAAAGATS